MNKNCSTCAHFPNTSHCNGCMWDAGTQGNTKWYSKETVFIYLEGAKDSLDVMKSVIDDIKADVLKISDEEKTIDPVWSSGLRYAIKIINDHM